MKIYIYTLEHPITNEIRYVGQTNDLKRRFNRHISNSRSFKDKRHISNWIRSLGNLIPIMKVIEECNYSERNDRENYWIEYYKGLNYNLCNSSNGGAGAGLNNKNCLGRIVSEETKAKISKSNKGRIRNYNTKGGSPGKKIYMYSLNKILIKTFSSIKETCEYTGLNRVTIQRNIKNISKNKKYIFTTNPL